MRRIEDDTVGPVENVYVEVPIGVRRHVPIKTEESTGSSALVVNARRSPTGQSTTLSGRGEDNAVPVRIQPRAAARQAVTVAS